MDKFIPSQKKLRAYAQVGTWVVPKSSVGHMCPEGRCPINPAPKAKRKRLAPMSVRVSAVQRAAIRAKALAAGLSVNQFLLLQALGPDLAPLRLNSADRAERAQALRAYRGTGNLLNQIAKQLNSGRILGALDVEAAIKWHEDNAALMLAAFIKRLAQ